MTAVAVVRISLPLRKNRTSTVNRYVIVLKSMKTSEEQKNLGLAFLGFFLHILQPRQLMKARSKPEVQERDLYSIVLQNSCVVRFVDARKNTYGYT